MRLVWSLGPFCVLTAMMALTRGVYPVLVAAWVCSLFFAVWRLVASTRAAFDGLNAGIAILDAAERVVYANLHAERMVASGHVLASGSDQRSKPEGGRVVLTESHQGQQNELSLLIRSARSSHSRHFSKAMVVVQPDGTPLSVIHAAPLLRATGSSVAGDGRVILYVYDQSAIDISPATLERLFGLTPAEANAALQVPRGGTVSEMAARLGVSANTLKTQLKAVYEKTTTHRHVDLLKLLLALSRR